MDIELINALANLIQIPIVVAVLIYFMQEAKNTIGYYQEIIDKLLNNKKDK